MLCYHYQAEGRLWGGSESSESSKSGFGPVDHLRVAGSPPNSQDLFYSRVLLILSVSMHFGLFFSYKMYFLVESGGMGLTGFHWWVGCYKGNPTRYWSCPVRKFRFAKKKVDFFEIFRMLYFFVFQSWELCFSGFFCLILKHPFPVNQNHDFSENPCFSGGWVYMTSRDRKTWIFTGNGRFRTRQKKPEKRSSQL